MKIGIVHYRVGRTDGVSLEIAKRKTILTSMGHTVRLIAGPVSDDCDLIIPELEFDTPGIRQIKENSFSFFNNNSLSEVQLKARIESVAQSIHNQFIQYYEQERFDCLLIHNIFSHGRHIAAAKAFADVVDELGLPVISTDHDWYWERPEYQDNRFPWIRDFLEQYVPSRLDQITHVCINSIARRELRDRCGIEADVLGDIFDFHQSPWATDPFNQDLLSRLELTCNDLIILQATRIVERKNIETAIHLAAHLAEIKPFLQGRRLYNGKILTEQSNIVLILAGYAEESSVSYLGKLKELCEDRGVKAKFADDLFTSQRQEGPTKRYALWDAYAHCDLVTYPSLQEGWGNQFIEAVFARKPIAIFEYPVFKTDIQPEGYFVVSLGDTTAGYDRDGLVVADAPSLDRAVSQLGQVLVSEVTPMLLEENFRIGQEHHGFGAMESYLKAHLPK